MKELKIVYRNVFDNLREISQDELLTARIEDKIGIKKINQEDIDKLFSPLGIKPWGAQRFWARRFLKGESFALLGPTGSGKTTTLYSILHKINTPRVNIITIEDPVEYEIEGVTQVQVNPAAGLTFASALRSFFRQDPDIIMVGEIRDKETTELAIRAALTGHLVFSTLHTNDAAGTPPRLIDMGAEPFLLASSMLCVVGQRVVRRICNKCKEEYEPPPAVVSDIKKVLGDLYPKKRGKLKLYRGKKCPACNQSGYSGRIGIFEVLPISEKIARLILERAPASKIEKQAREEGMVTMKQDGYLKAIEGITTIEEVLRVAEEAR